MSRTISDIDFRLASDGSVKVWVKRNFNDFFSAATADDLVQIGRYMERLIAPPSAPYVPPVTITAPAMPTPPWTVTSGDTIPCNLSDRDAVERALAKNPQFKWALEPTQGTAAA